jgi:hypothetical protein
MLETRKRWPNFFLDILDRNKPNIEAGLILK